MQGANIVSVGKLAFAQAKNLKAFTVGKNVKTVGKNVFKGSTKLKTVTVKSGKLTKASLANLVRGSNVKTVKASGVPKKVKKSYAKTLANYGVKVK